MIIRKAKRSDLNGASEVFKIESSKPPYKQKWTVKTAEAKLSKFLKEEFFVAIDNKKVIGFITAALSSEGSYIDEFWISKKYQGKGIGRKLIERVEETCKKKGSKKIMVLVTPTADAFHAYKKFGYGVREKLVYIEKELK